MSGADPSHASSLQSTSFSPLIEVLLGSDRRYSLLHEVSQRYARQVVARDAELTAVFHSIGLAPLSYAHALQTDDRPPERAQLLASEDRVVNPQACSPRSMAHQRP